MSRAETIADLVEAGTTHHRAGRLTEARKAFERVLRSQPRNAGALQWLGRVHIQAGEPDKGLRLVRRAAAFHPNDATAQASLGEALVLLSQLDEAVSVFDRALALDPRHADAHYLRGYALRQAGRAEDALAAFDQALAQDPRSLKALVGRGLALKGLDRYEESLAAFDAALALEPSLALIQSNRGNVLHDLQRFPEALAAYDKALAADPNSPEVWSNRATTLLEFRRFDEAIANCRRAIELQPSFVNAHMNLALARLLLGNLKAGFARAEWRRFIAVGQGKMRGLAQPLWFGEADPVGKTILLYDDQGFGDALHFCRYAPRVAALGARVILAVQPALIRLMRSLEGPSEVVSLNGPLPPHDLQCPLNSLPMVFEDSLETIPAPTSYLSAPEDARLAWARRLGPRTRPRIGIAWAGARTIVTRRLPLPLLLEALPEGLDLFTLQPGIDEASAARLDAAGVNRTDGQIGDFADTAGLIANLDLVVSIDTSGAHLTGALGAPGRVLVLYTPDWRWFLEREDSPWYPSLRVLRQARPADWSAPLAKLGQELRALAKS